MYEIRGKYLWIEAHAYEGMNAERPPVKLEYLYETVDDADKTVAEGPTCHSCDLDMDETILKIRYPKGTLPVRGFACPKCGYEVISFEDAKAASETAERLGLLEPEGVITRKITRSGDQLAVSIPKDIEREFDLKQGAKVKIYTKRDEIILAPV